MIKNSEVDIGGARIDQQDGQFLNIWRQLTMDHSKVAGYELMIGHGGTATTGYCSLQKVGMASGTTYKTYTPLQFWFCQFAGLALPLISVQYHEVRIHVEYRDVASLYVKGTASGTVEGSAMTNAQLLVNYYYVDLIERKKFTQEMQEYLITQTQSTGEESVSSANQTISLTPFSHPVKELIWYVQPQANQLVAAGLNWSAYGLSTAAGVAQNPVAKAKLQFNGQDRFQEREGGFFSLVQPVSHHTACPSDRGINVYSFAINPEQHQPQGTANFSRLDTVSLKLTLTGVSASSGLTANAKVYAINYNILKMENGLAGVIYSS